MKTWTTKLLAISLADGDNSYSFETSNGIQTIRYPKIGHFLGPYVVAP
jgi:hypothetical protein